MVYFSLKLIPLISVGLIQHPSATRQVTLGMESSPWLPLVLVMEAPHEAKHG